MRTRCALVTTLAILWVSSAQAADWAAIVQRVSPSIVRIEGQDADGQWACSGVVFAPERVITNAHCVGTDVSDRAIVVARKDAEVLRLNRILDLAVLKVRKLTAPPLAFSRRPILVGMSVGMLGYGLGSLHLKFQAGYVSDATEDALAFGTWLDVVMVPGDSGGAIVDEAGDLVTLARGAIGVPGNLAGGHGLGVEPDVLREFVEPYVPPKP
jgi:S1-C subfamily serine protease